MDKADKKTLIIFLVIVFLLILLFGFNWYKSKKLEDIDRKVKLIFNVMTYSEVEDKTQKLFSDAVALIKNNKSFTYELNDNGKVKYYSVSDCEKCNRITNFDTVTNTFSSKLLEEFMSYKKIIKSDNKYYIESYEEKANNYIGSIIELDHYDNSNVYFKSKNYYCDEYSYMGLMHEEPNCDYTKKETYFTVGLEYNTLKINDIELIKNIVK